MSRGKEHEAGEPIVKWAGGKTRLLPELIARMPTTFSRYFEPFAGGAALFFKLAPGRAVLADANAELINVYRQVVTNVEDVIGLVEHHRDNHCADWYGYIRDSWNAHEYAADDVARAAALLYLNRTCFNGLWRVNRLGEFNVPMGRYADPLAGMADRMRAAVPALARADLRVGDYRNTLHDVAAGDFVYLDPPYDALTKTANFTAYTAGGFGINQQAELSDLVNDLAARGAYVLASNADTPYIRKLYAAHRVDSVQVARAINSNASKRGAVGEVLITAGRAANAEAA